MPRIPLRTAKRWRARSAISLPAICLPWVTAVPTEQALRLEIVTGAFQTHAGTVKSVDAAKNEVVITELQSKKGRNSIVGVDVGFEKVSPSRWPR